MGRRGAMAPLHTFYHCNLLGHFQEGILEFRNKPQFFRTASKIICRMSPVTISEAVSVLRNLCAQQEGQVELQLHLNAGLYW